MTAVTTRTHLRESRLLQALARTAAFLAALPAVWWAVAVALASDRGLDLTDEGLYLLGADPPSRTATWDFPYGWITGPVLRSVDGDIARFRTLGGVILVVAAALLASEALRRCAPPTTAPSAPGSTPPGIRALVVGTLAASSLLYYSELALLRVPSYNWVNLVGILLAMSGILRAARPPTAGAPADRSTPGFVPSTSWGASAIAAGAFVAGHAKPTTPILLAFVGVPFLLRTVGLHRTRNTVLLALGQGLALTGAAIVTPFWPPDFLAPFLRAVRVPSLGEGYVLSTALLRLAASPIELLRRAVLDQPRWLVGVTVVLLVAGLLVRIAQRGGNGQSLGSLALAPAGVLIGLLGSLSIGLWDALGVSSAGIVVGLLEILIAAVILLPLPAGPVTAARSEERDLRQACRVVATPMLLLSGVPIYALGHDTGPVNAMPAAAVLAAVALVIVVADRSRMPSVALFAVSVVLIATTASSLARSWETPYRSAPIAEQIVPVPVGGSGSLRLDPGLAGYIDALRSAATADGWQAGDRLYGLHVTWSSTIPYLLDATVPPSLMPSLQLHDRGLERLRFDLARQDLTGWDTAWLILPDPMLSPEDGIEPEELRAVEEAVALFTARVGTRWPTDYALVWTAPSDAPRSPHSRITLWKPTALPR